MVLGKVIGYQPTDAIGFTRPFCKECTKTWQTKQEQCPFCEKPWGNTFTWIFLLSIDDGSGKLPLIACFDDAVRFLGGLIPTDLQEDQITRRRLESVIQTLHNQDALFGISSYEISGQRKYRITDTTINF